MDFRWNDWNEEHVGNHGVSPEEAEYVVRRAKSPFPRSIGDDKLLVWGRGNGGRYLQVVFIFDNDETAYIIHARLLNDKEKRRYKRIMRL